MFCEWFWLLHRPARSDASCGSLAELKRQERDFMQRLVRISRYNAYPVLYLSSPAAKQTSDRPEVPIYPAIPHIQGGHSSKHNVPTVTATLTPKCNYLMCSLTIGCLRTHTIGSPVSTTVSSCPPVIGSVIPCIYVLRRNEKYQIQSPKPPGPKENTRKNLQSVIL